MNLLCRLVGVVESYSCRAAGFLVAEMRRSSCDCHLISPRCCSHFAETLLSGVALHHKVDRALVGPQQEVIGSAHASAIDGTVTPRKVRRSSSSLDACFT